METHRCSACGADKPLGEFYKHRALVTDKAWANRVAWSCDDCRNATRRAWNAKHPGYSTDAVRKYRSDPEKRERDRRRARAWKDANREANRARDREYQRRRRAEAA